MKTLKSLLLISILSIFLLLTSCSGSQDSTTEVSSKTTITYKNTSMSDSNEGSEKGRVVLAITDAAADMGSVTKVNVVVDSVRVHSAAEGWVTVSTEDKTYDLLELKSSGSAKLLADIQLKEGTYDQMRLDIKSVTVVDANGTHEAKLPSNQLKMMGNFVVKANSTATATFDFIADESLHITGNGQYIMAPVVKLETREDADVDVSSDKKVKINGGKIKTNTKVGMNVTGTVGVGLGIAKSAVVTLDVGGIIKSNGKSNAEAKARAKAEARADADEDEEMDDDDSSASSSGSVGVGTSGSAGIGVGSSGRSNASAQGQAGVGVSVY